jgi:hypothetical protein
MLTIDLVAKQTGTKVSAQWSNDEVVHQILVDLLNGATPEGETDLLKRVAPRKVAINIRKRLRSYG